MKIKTFSIVSFILVTLFFLECSISIADDPARPYNLLQHLKNIPKQTKKTKKKQLKSTTSDINLKDRNKSKNKIQTHKVVPKQLDVVVMQNIESTEIIFPWNEPVNMASYIRNDFLYVVFDKYVPVKVRILNEYTDTKVLGHSIVDNFYSYKIGPHAMVVAFKLVGQKMSNLYSLAFKDKNSIIIKTFTQKIKSRSIDFVSKPFDEPTPTIEFDIESLDVGKLISFTDPLNKDKITVLTTNSYPYSIRRHYSFVDLDILPSIQGVAILEKYNKLLFHKNNVLFWISSKKGLNISSKYGSSIVNSIFETPGFTKLKEFENEDGILAIKPYRKELAGYIKRQESIQKQIYNSSIDKEYNYRINMALLNLANDFYPETNAQLKFSYINNPLLKDKYDFLLVYAVSNFMNNRFGKAEKLISQIDISSVPIKNLKEVRFWNDIINLSNNNIERLSGNIIEIFSEDNNKFLKSYPENILIKIKLLELKFLIKNNYFSAAKDTILYLSKVNLTGDDLAEFYYQQANLQKLADNNYGVRKFLTECKNIDNSIYFKSKCTYELINLDLKDKKISAQDAINKLLYLDFDVRNSEFEITVLKRLADLYYINKDYMNALLTWRTIAEYFQDSFESLTAKEKMTTTFVNIFLQDIGDKYNDFQKVAIFDEFSNLNPIGSIGDKIALKLANYLIELDLLERASQILNHQYKYRLSGYEREEVLNKLLSVYLELNKPEDVIKLVNKNLLKDYPDQIKIPRIHLYAQALFKLNDDDKAIKILEGDLSDGADSIRSNIYWKKKNWNLFNDNSEPYIYSLMKSNKPLTVEDADKILKQSISYSYLDRKKLLFNLYNNFKNRLEVKHKKILNIIYLLVKLQNTKSSKKIVEAQDIQNIINNVYNQITH